jgi:Cu/Zn superoxide dismutase
MVLALATLAFGVTQGFSRSAATKTAPIEKKNANCGLTTGGKHIGTATFTRSGDTLRATASMKNAPPGDYYLYLYDADSCTTIKTLGKFKVDSSGNGSKSGTADVTGYNRFFLDAYNNTKGFDNDSLIVNL